MARDVNITILSGTLVDLPKIHVLKSTKKILSFTLKVTEKFELASGDSGSHENFVDFEALGKHADNFHKTLVVGKRYQITGYLRQDSYNGVESLRVRCFNIQTAD